MKLAAVCALLAASVAGAQMRVLKLPPDAMAPERAGPANLDFEKGTPGQAAARVVGGAGIAHCGLFGGVAAGGVPRRARLCGAGSGTAGAAWRRRRPVPAMPG